MRFAFVALASLVLLALLAPAAAWPAGEVASALPESPQALFGELFVAVQQAHLFPDSKVFPDAVPRLAPDLILQRFRQERPQSAAALRSFVDVNFTLPSDAATVMATERLGLGAHIDALWDRLIRSSAAAPAYSSLLPVPRPYVVPGGRFREMYYWDSYFTMLGLVDSGRRELAGDMVRNFASLIDTYGHVPNGTRTYYLSRSQPPFFFKMVGLMSEEDPAAAYARYLPELRREYAFWMQGAADLRRGTAHRRVVALPDGGILNRYWDDAASPRDESYREDAELARSSGREPRQLYRDIRAAAESGWDFSSRWFAEAQDRASIRTTQILPVDLNSLLFGLEAAIRAGCERVGNAACGREFARRTDDRKRAMDRYLWDAHAGAYFDYHWTQGRRNPQLTAATLYPLFVAAASNAQASQVADAVARTLLRPGGLVTTTQQTGQQWDAPNGWAPLQWIAIAGLRQYHEDRPAEAIACRWLVNVRRVFEQSGKLIEKYDVVSTGRSGGGGEYPLQDGFGWTNGVTRRLLSLYPAVATYSSADQCASGATSPQ